ncbi:MAG: aminotransferase class III-fold pyridoxal phosphate-dependent enzyme [Thermoleophilia bacterium]|nr:aminotransferase class III-fold pyridoxal phosphate-dependent enzyme [Thermoleophilia bacterium]MDH5334007.1 aminotransferase class III-fold pyridoxal phosphate-dependent enzyme [Thermoleophilia bacterium]
MPTRSEMQFARIAETVAGGESSYSRLRAGGQLVMEEAAGARIRDADGATYLDYCGGYGVNLFGHAPPFLLDAVRDVVDRIGVHVAYPHRLAGEVGELVVSLVPGIEQLRYAASGTEATQAAVRLVRAATGRDLILKFEGHYHGWADHLCTGLGDGSASRPARPDSLGVPAAALEAVWVLPFNDLAALRSAIAEAGERLAGVILEPAAGSGGLMRPTPAFLDALLAEVRAAGGLVILDEVMTGFRLAPGGAQELLGVTPDVTVLGKIVGGGFGLAAFGGSRELMRLEAENRVVHGGTTSGSPVALAASRAVLTRLHGEPELYEGLEATSASLADGLERAFADAGVAGHVRRVGSMLQPFFSERPDAEPGSLAEVAALQDDGLFLAFCDALEARGVIGHRYPLGRWFVSLAHTPADVEETVAAVGDALRWLAEGSASG